MRVLIASFIAIFLAGCASSSTPQGISQDLARDTGVMAERYLQALAAKDRAQLEALGRSPAAIDTDLSDRPPLATSAHPQFTADGLVADKYMRQYSVALIDGRVVEIRIYFIYRDGPQIARYIVLPHDK